MSCQNRTPHHVCRLGESSRYGYFRKYNVPKSCTYQLGVEFGQTRLTLAIEDQDGVDHDGSRFSSDMGLGGMFLVWNCSTACR